LKNQKCSATLPQRGRRKIHIYSQHRKCKPVKANKNKYPDNPKPAKAKDTTTNNNGYANKITSRRPP